MIVCTLCYCKKCGRIVVFLSDKDEKICDYCKSKVFPVPEQFLNSEISINEDLKENFVNNYIKNSPEFDQRLYDDREKKAIQHANDFEEQMLIMNRGKEILEERNRKPKCTYCGSANIRKIGVLDRVISTELWGLGSKKIGKQFHCNNCGADF